MNRRQCLALGLAWPWWFDARGVPNRAALTFPRDLGSHPEYAIEWWYLTGQLLAGPRRFGFQLTFFRSRVPQTQGMRSAFAAKQLIFAHAAVTDVAGLRHLHDQRIGRASGETALDLARASTSDTDVQLTNWRLLREGSTYLAQASGSGFSFQLALRETQARLLQGDQGWSRKGPGAAQASHYYSLPQLSASGQLQLAGDPLKVQGQAWLDHEWCQSLMPPNAVGWDWIGMNLTDGSALTAFRLRTSTGESLWAGGSFRAAGQSSPEVFEPEAVVFTAGRTWKSPASGSTYPVEWFVFVTHADRGNSPGPKRYRVRAVIDHQELDSRASTGAIYWEGLSELLNDHGQVIGQGYLEMTGYSSPLRL
ncbi:MAG: putative AttH [Comamonadaceae bacterium]|nr:MAG: putative AttH [Comamonadaceae bacterium]